MPKFKSCEVVCGGVQRTVELRGQGVYLDGVQIGTARYIRQCHCEGRFGEIVCTAEDALTMVMVRRTLEELCVAMATRVLESSILYSGV